MLANLDCGNCLEIYVCMLSHCCVQLFMGSPPGSSAHVISQARTLESGATSYSKGSSQPRDRTCVSVSPTLAGR